MKMPKVLPWLARKAGLTDEQIKLLWDSALHHASSRQPQLAANQRMAAAMQELTARLCREGSRKNSIRTPVRTAADEAGRQAGAAELLPA